MRRHDYSQFGQEGELYVADELRRRGYVVEWVGDHADYDLVIDGRVRAEVKSAFRTPGHRGQRWQFSLRRHGLEIDEELLFLLCYDDEMEIAGVFVIPGAEVEPDLTKIDITSSPSSYHGRWASFLGAWGRVDDVLDAMPRGQAVLFRPQRVEEPIPF